MRDIYIQKIHINEIRHLSDIDIEISFEEKKHLILTGKNGSGKTTLLNGIVKYLGFIERNEGTFPDNLYRAVSTYENRLNQLKGCTDEKSKEDYRRCEIELENRKSRIPIRTHGLALDIKNKPDCVSDYDAGKFIICSLEAKRASRFDKPEGVSKIIFDDKYNFDAQANTTFVKYMVDLKTQQAYANQESDDEGLKYYNWWFENLEKLLCKLYNDGELKLIYDYKNYDFKIHTSDGKQFGFNEMSDGYSAVFDIVSEVMSRMENYTQYRYNFQGVVLIDEVETHLHVELQKSVLPILLSLFPNIQFIVTTHSPFVLSSIKNAVVYDIEKKERVEDLSKYSYENIIQNYFEVDSYSIEIMNVMRDYEYKINKYCETREENLLEDISNIETYFEESDFSLDESLLYHFNKLKLRKKVVQNG